MKKIRDVLRLTHALGMSRRRWSKQWLYETLKLFNSYRVRHAMLKGAPA